MDDLQTWLYVLLYVTYFFMISWVLVLIPVYCWIAVFFSIPLFFIEPIIAYVAYYYGGTYTGSNNASYVLILVTVLWACIPLADFMAIFGEIFLIPSFLLGLPGFSITFGVGLLILSSVKFFI